MKIPDNLVLFELWGLSWTLGALLLSMGFVLFLVSTAVVPIVASRFGTIRRMSSEEAAEYAFTGHKDIGDVSPAVHGPAVGKEWGYSFCIGDLRQLWKQKRYKAFFGLPLHGATFSFSFILMGHGSTLLLRVWALEMFSAFAFLLIAMSAFMMWAAVNTKLE